MKNGGESNQKVDPRVKPVCLSKYRVRRKGPQSSKSLTGFWFCL